MKTMGIYIHIPFCNSKCAYCDFVSAVRTDDEKSEYFNRLKEDISEFSRNEATNDRVVDSIYIGGGTPSCVDAGYIADTLGALRSAFDVSANAEISIEANPESLTAQKAKVYAAAGVNRISMGLQAASDELLAAIGRRHTVADFVRSADVAQSLFPEVSADMMLGLPGQTVRDCERTVKLIAGRGFTHVSAYALKVEEGTPLAASGYVPDADYSADLYDRVSEMLRDFGFEWYEVSNFAVPGHECRHNLRYWRRGEYLGFGVSAHSFFNDERFAVTSDFNAYLAGEGVTERRYIPSDGEEAAEETIMLALRTREGLDLKKFTADFGRDLLSERKDQAELLKEGGYIETDGERLRLTEKGLYVMNDIIVRLAM